MIKKIKHLSLILLLALAVSACGQTQAIPFEESIVVEAGEDKALLLDVRSPDEYTSGHVKEAINLPVNNLDEIESLTKSKDETIYVYCRSGNRSQKAKTLLEEKGYTKVIDLGGISNYKGELEK